jgi:hypothetical protein
VEVLDSEVGNIAMTADGALKLSTCMGIDSELVRDPLIDGIFEDAIDGSEFMRELVDSNCNHRIPVGSQCRSSSHYFHFACISTDACLGPATVQHTSMSIDCNNSRMSSHGNFPHNTQLRYRTIHIHWEF